MGSQDTMSTEARDHYLRVADQFPKGSDEWLAGYLHDFAEDFGLSVETVAPAFLYDTLDALTRRDGEVYVDYIARCASDDMARRVKIADLRDNLARMDAAHESLRPRYEKALGVLSDA